MDNSRFKTDLRSRCYTFSLNIISTVNGLPSNRVAWIIGDQIIRSATSIGANLIEAKASSSRLEFKKFYEISLKSANETQYWLELLKDSKLSEVSVIDDLLRELNELCKMLASGVIKLKSKL